MAGGAIARGAGGTARPDRGRSALALASGGKDRHEASKLAAAALGALQALAVAADSAKALDYGAALIAAELIQRHRSDSVPQTYPARQSLYHRLATGVNCERARRVGRGSHGVAPGLQHPPRSRQGTGVRASRRPSHVAGYGLALPRALVCFPGLTSDVVYVTLVLRWRSTRH